MSNQPPRKPLKSTQSVPFDGVTGSKGSEDRHALRMLVIDTDDSTRRSLVEHYSKNGWSVRCATNTQEAIDSALEDPPDVIVLTLLMPDINPRHFVRTLRGAIEHDVRVIGTATTSASIFESARQAGVDVVFPMPLDLAAVDAFLAMKRV